MRYRRPDQEVLVGSASYLDSLAGTSTPVEPDRESIALVEAIIPRLSPTLQEIYYLKYAERLSLRQIARRFGKSKGWAQWNVRKLHEKVRQEIELLHQETTQDSS